MKNTGGSLILSLNAFRNFNMKKKKKRKKILKITVFLILDSHPGMTGALWVLCGVLLFSIIEKIFSSCANADEKPESSENELVDARKTGNNQPIKIAGYLNLMANSIDNFTQGLAVAASFLVSFRQGLLGTIAILCKFDFSRFKLF